MGFGENFRQLLEDKEISRRDFSKITGIPYSSIGNYIIDARQPDYDTLKLIADALDVSIDYLLDHPVGKAESPGEDRLLRIYRSLSPAKQKTYLKIGETLLKENKD